MCWKSAFALFCRSFNKGCVLKLHRWIPTLKPRQKRSQPMLLLDFFFCFFFFCPYLEGPCPRQDSMAVIWGPMGQGACKSPYLQGSTKLKGLKPLKLYFSVKELHHLFFFYRNDASSFRGISFLKQTQSWTCTDISVWSTCSRFSLFLKRWISLNSSVNFIVPTQHCTAYSWMS